MAQAAQKKGMLSQKSKGKRFTFEGKNTHTDQIVRGEVVARDEDEARKKLQRRGIRPLRISKVKAVRKRRITQEDITVFTRQLATMMKAGLPLMQAFEIVARGHSNPTMTQMLMQIRAEVEQGSALGKSFAKHPKYFDRFYCNLVSAGETGGVLESLLDKLAVYKEKTQAIKKKVKTALTYPISIVVVAVVLLFVMMMFVLPAFKEVYNSMGAELPWLTQVVMNISDIFVEYGWIMIIGLIVIGFGVYKLHQNSPAFQKRVDAMMLKLPIFGSIVKKATIARWSRTTSTLFAAGVPLVEALDSVAGASGNILYEEATQDIRAKVTQGLSLTSSMQTTEMFPNMVVQMAAIGEESGSLDDLLNKVAEFYEDEVDNSVSQLSSLMEPIIMVVLGTVIGVLLVAMYLPLFNLGSVVG
ncbi:type II secretion system F family protein [Neisseria iguanae]|uniref:Type II secretion system protein F n=1 Tax=Neisseria iguanae TaxID=90242 RepID=A0A2P7TY56_9NEIS|nr:type II secretion system F family protein [Neisseria iguanae]PSJ79583.1 type II secretion system protein F [Neisseria iguanae]